MVKIQVKSGKILTEREFVINIAKLRKLRISPDEYIMLEIVSKFVSKHREMTLCDFSEMMYMYNIKDLNTKVQRLQKLKLVVYIKTEDKCKGYIEIRESWHSNTKDSLDDFEMFWLSYYLLGKKFGCPVGNKKKAQEMWQRVIKSGVQSHDLKKVFWPRYQKFIEQADIPMMHCSSFLNPHYERFREEFIIKKSKHEQDISKIGTDFSGRR